MQPGNVRQRNGGAYLLALLDFSSEVHFSLAGHKSSMVQHDFVE